jgi:hypothetical protein
LDNYELAGRGSVVDGFCMSYQGARPFIIPKGTFGNAPAAPVLTVAIDAVLLARTDLDEDLVYQLVKSLLENQQTLARANPLLRETDEQFDKSSLSYPLHPGAMRYYDRNEPTFIERYVDLIGVGISLSIGLAGAISGFVRWNNRRRKNRIDRYYVEVLAIEGSIEGLTTIEECSRAIAALLDLRRAAFRQLIDEKLAADESFRIFIALVDDVEARIEQRLRGLG